VTFNRLKFCEVCKVLSCNYDAFKTDAQCWVFYFDNVINR